MDNSPAPVYIWYSGDTFYYYSEADKIYMNENSSKIFDVCWDFNDVS